MTPITSSAVVGDRQGQKPHGGVGGEHRVQDSAAAPVGQVDVQQHHVGHEGADAGDRGGDVAGLADDVDRRLDLGADPGADQGVVVDDVDTGPPGLRLPVRRLPGR
jgi:hypothetical protein